MDTVVDLLVWCMEHLFVFLFVLFFVVGIGFGSDDEEQEQDCLGEYIGGYVTGIPNGSWCSWMGAMENWDEEDQYFDTFDDM